MSENDPRKITDVRALMAMLNSRNWKTRKTNRQKKTFAIMLKPVTYDE